MHPRLTHLGGCPSPCVAVPARTAVNSDLDHPQRLSPRLSPVPSLSDVEWSEMERMIESKVQEGLQLMQDERRSQQGLDDNGMRGRGSPPYVSPLSRSRSPLPGPRRPMAVPADHGRSMPHYPLGDPRGEGGRPRTRSRSPYGEGEHRDVNRASVAMRDRPRSPYGDELPIPPAGGRAVSAPRGDR